MAYTIYKGDGTAITVADNAIDTDFYNPAGGNAGNGLGIQLIGRNAIDYGAAVAQNFLQQQQNFASLNVPSDAKSQQGQLWFKRTSATDGELYLRVTSNISGGILNWRKVTVVNPTVPGDGDIQVVGSVISIYANGAWRQVFPAVYS